MLATADSESHSNMLGQAKMNGRPWRQRAGLFGQDERSKQSVFQRKPTLSRADYEDKKEISTPKHRIPGRTRSMEISVPSLFPLSPIKHLSRNKSVGTTATEGTESSAAVPTNYTSPTKSNKYVRKEQSSKRPLAIEPQVTSPTKNTNKGSVAGLAAAGNLSPIKLNRSESTQSPKNHRRRQVHRSRSMDTPLYVIHNGAKVAESVALRRAVSTRLEPEKRQVRRGVSRNSSWYNLTDPWDDLKYLAIEATNVQKETKVVADPKTPTDQATRQAFSRSSSEEKSVSEDLSRIKLERYTLNSRNSTDLVVLSDPNDCIALVKSPSNSDDNKKQHSPLKAPVTGPTTSPFSVEFDDSESFQDNDDDGSCELDNSWSNIDTESVCEALGRLGHASLLMRTMNHSRSSFVDCHLPDSVSMLSGVSFDLSLNESVASEEHLYS